jgi:hypothetical protein
LDGDNSMAKRRNVESRRDKREPAATIDAHERGKEFLNPSEMDRLLEAAKRGRHGTRDYLLMHFNRARSGMKRGAASCIALIQLSF